MRKMLGSLLIFLTLLLSFSYDVHADDEEIPDPSSITEEKQ